jgi:hypothetical protein
LNLWGNEQKESWNNFIRESFERTKLNNPTQLKIQQTFLNNPKQNPWTGWAR